MKILGIETSCDETSASVVENGEIILSNVIISQINLFSTYGGVIPEISARSHLEVILPVVQKALKDANCTWDDINAIAVTHAPGLLGSLLIGTLTARTLAILHHKPLYAIHHLKSHIYANWLIKEASNTTNKTTPSSYHATNITEKKTITEPPFTYQYKHNITKTHNIPYKTLKEKTTLPTFPLLALVISGGHTQIIKMAKHNHFEIIGTTLDDAVGECFDKVAKVLGLPYPGGPAIAKTAKIGNPNKYHFPHPKVNQLNFSFSGLKTAVLRTIQKELALPISHPSHDLKNHLNPQQIADFSASFQQTAIDILLEKLNLALKQYPDTKSIVFAGGVSANELLRKKVNNLFLCNTPTKIVLSSSTTIKNESHPIYEHSSPKYHKNNTNQTSLHENRSYVFFPEKSLSGDNAAMVATAAYYEIKSNIKATDPYKLNIYPRIPIS